MTPGIVGKSQFQRRFKRDVVRLMTEGRQSEICSGTELPSEWRRLLFHNIIIAAVFGKDGFSLDFC